MSSSFCVNICTGAKYHRANDAVRVILRDGSIKPLSAPSSVTALSEEGQEMCQYVSEVSRLLSYSIPHPTLYFENP